MTTRCVNAESYGMLVKQVRKGRVTIEEAAEDAGMTVEESSGNIKLKMCRKVEMFDKRMVLGVIVP